MSVIDDHLTKYPEAERMLLQHIRELVLKTAPDATEVITYAMPGFKWKGKYLLAFDAFKDHLSLFPGAETIAALEDVLKPFKTAKGTIQFTLEHPLSDNIVIAIVQERMQEIELAAQHKK